jgi:radical SAM superfamily enzyme YgiQ (UPF0313 family)
VDPRQRLQQDADVLLVYPKTGMDVGSAVTPPHSLLAVAASLHRDGCRVRIIDQRTDRQWRRSLALALQGEPICVGITSMVGAQIAFGLEAARLVREKARGYVPIVWGGPHPSSVPEQTLENDAVDIVCIGEGDVTFPELVNTLSSHEPLSKVQGIGFKDGGKTVITQPRELVDVETLPPVPWDLVDVEDYVRPDFYLKASPRTLDIGQTSRGCPFKCGFCSSAGLRRRTWRALSSEASVALIEEAVRRFNLNGIWIRDDEFHVDRTRTSEICDGILAKGLDISWYTAGTRVDLFNKASDEEIALLRRSGAYALKFGVESGSNRILDLIEKGVTWQEALEANRRAKRHGIVFGFSLMMGFPTETFEEIYQTVNLAQRIRADNPGAQLETIGTYTPLPGTPLFALALEHGLRPPETLGGWMDWDFWEYDLEGKRIPWFSLKDRKRIGNIGYYHTLAHALPNLIDSVSNRALRTALKMLSGPAAAYSRFRIEKKRFGFAPELALLRLLRQRLLYRGGLSLP